VYLKRCTTEKFTGRRKGGPAFGDRDLYAGLRATLSFSGNSRAIVTEK
jgi:hypothetical protein